MSQVKLILTESVHSLGEAGDLVSVKPGFARNFLLPQGRAIQATESRVKELGHHKRIVAEKAAKELSDLEAAKQRLEAVRIEITARVGAEGKLFGSVTTAQIAEKLAEQGFELDRRRIALQDPIKEVGEHTVPIKLHREIVASITVAVAGEDAPPAEEPDDEPEDDRRPREDDDDARFSDGDEDD